MFYQYYVYYIYDFIKLRLNCTNITGGKHGESRHSLTVGRVKRIFDIYPYPRGGTLKMVICDTKGAALATAPQERSKTHFYKVEEIPIVWYLTSTTVAGQGEMMRKALTDHIYKDQRITAVNIIWIPCSGIPGLMCLPRDIYEVELKSAMKSAINIKLTSR